MSKKPVLEEVDDEIDNMDMDIAEFDPNLKTPVAPLRPQPQVVRSQDSEPPLFPNMPMAPPVPAPANPPAKRQDIIDPNSFTAEERELLSKFQIIYPCYFDINRSHQQGRRVSKEYAVENPLAKTISDACRSFRLQVLLELDKTHPQDFGNPGRVRVLIKENGSAKDGRFPNKRALLNKIGQYLKDHPTTLDSITAKSGVALPAEFQQGFEPSVIPKVKGFAMNTIVPVHSEYTLKHPMTKSIYDPEPEVPNQDKPVQKQKQPKKKVMKIRG